MNPVIHAENSIKKFGGVTSEDFDKYLKIHEKMDCFKAYVSSNLHRLFTHHLPWVQEVMIPIFGSFIVLSSGKKISVKDICEWHILEDFRMKGLPSITDYITGFEMHDWMKNGQGDIPSQTPSIESKKETDSFSLTTEDLSGILRRIKEEQENNNKKEVKPFRLEDKEVPPKLPRVDPGELKDDWRNRLLD